MNHLCISICNRYHLNPQRTCMVGDRLDTDIAFGKKGNLQTLLVFSGVATREEFATADPAAKPNYTLDSFGSLHRLVEQAEALRAQGGQGTQGAVKGR